METVADRVRAVLGDLREAERRAGRSEGSVTLCAVTKTFPASDVLAALAAGVTDIGENRVQEAVEKHEAVAAAGARARWHLIGHLQSNKARRAAEHFDVVESVDRVEIVERLDRTATELGRTLEVLVQIDLGGEPTKSGAREEEADAVVSAARAAESLRLTGLMTVPPYFDDPEDARPYFRRLRELADGYGLSTLSMGMSHDYAIAVEEGATIVRIGTAIFGRR